MQDNFKFFLIGSGKRPFQGYVSSKDRTDLSSQFMIRGSQNVVKKKSGTIAVRHGLKRRGTADSTEAGTLAAFDWETSWGVTRVGRINNGKLQVESNIADGSTYVWYNLQTGLSLTAYVFDTVWDTTLKKDFLVFVRGDDNLFRWDGGIGVIASTTVNTIVLTATVASQGFNTTSGSVLINGTTYTYTGSSGSTLTGVGTDPTGEANGSVVISAVVTNATTPASGAENDFLKTINNQVYIGSYTSRLVYISEDDDYTDYTVPATRAPGDPELLVLDSNGKGIGVRQGKPHIFAGNSYLYVVSFNQITVGSTLTEQTLVDRKELATLEAALNHDFITSVGDDLVWLDQDNQLRVLGDFRNISQPRYPSLSSAIEDELKELDFTGGHIRSVGPIIYLTCPLSGKDFMHETETTVDSTGQITAERFWHAPQIRSISRIAVIDGVVYGHSSANPQIYQLWDTNQWKDDNPADEDLGYDAIMRLAYFNLTRGTENKNTFDKVYYEGYMSQGTYPDGIVLQNYQGASGVQSKKINSLETPAQFYSSASASSLGDTSLGDLPLGDGIEDIEQETTPKFRKILAFNPLNTYEFALQVSSSEPNSRWEILTIGPDIRESWEKPVELIS